MKKRIIPLFFLVLLLATVMIPTSAAISTKAISGKPTLKIEGTTAYCVGKYNSGNRNDAISITVTLMQGSKEIASWSASGKGSVTISKTCKVETKKTYKLVLSATVNGVAKPDVSVTATAKCEKLALQVCRAKGRPPFGLMFIEAGFLRVLEAGGINQMRGFTRC